MGMAKKEAEARYTEIISKAFKAPWSPSTGAYGGCGRVYVCLSYKAEKHEVAAVAKACKALGLIFHRKGYGGMRNSIYVGYDNASGLLAKGEAIASAMTEMGIPAYMEAHAD